MNKLFAVCTSLVLLPAASYAAESCEDMKSRIEAKLKGKGVKAYSLDIVGKDTKPEGKVVATCGAGSKQIVYSRK
jgi:hypothetical protein